MQIVTEILDNLGLTITLILLLTANALVFDWQMDKMEKRDKERSGYIAPSVQDKAK